MKLPARVRAFLLSWSLSNIILLDLWRELLRAPEPDYSYWVTHLSAGHFLALITLGVFGGIAGAAAAMGARSAGRFRYGWILILVAGALYFGNSVRRFLVELVSTGGPTAEKISLGVLLLAIVVCGAAIWSRRISGYRLGSIAGSLLFPFLVYCHVQAIRIMASGDLARDFAPAPLVESNPAGTRTPRRVVILILDEGDYGMMFEHRPPGLLLPHIDSLRRESFMATDAHAPGTWTHASVLSYLAGRHVLDPKPVSARDAAFVVGPDSSRYRFGSQPTFLRDAANKGARVGVVGWSIPYCRYPNLGASRCEFLGDRTFPSSYPEAALWMLAEVVTVGPILDRAYGVGLPYHTTEFVTLKRAAEEMIASPELDLLWIHLGVPHLPRMYDRATGKFVGPERVRREDYADNLALADLTVRDLRSAIEKSGDRETVLIVTSDHAFRFKAWAGYRAGDRIPLLIHMPYRPRGEVYGGRLNTLRIGELALRFLAGDTLRSDEISDLLSLP